MVVLGLHASSVKRSQLYCIKTFNSEHTCFGINSLRHAQADNGFLAQHLADKLKERPSYRPVDIVKDIQRDIGVKISYSTAFRVKQLANEINNGTHEAAYLALPQYCHDLELNNPNSSTILEKTSENKFNRLFICYGASVSGFATFHIQMVVIAFWEYMVGVFLEFQNLPVVNLEFCVFRGVILEFSHFF
jgi:hypothetical protein